MKALNYQEVTKIVEVLNKNLSGARLQKLCSLSNGVVLEFYNKGELYSVYMELGRVPFVLMDKAKLQISKKQVKPIEVFLRSHFTGSVCLGVFQPDKTERLIELTFSQERRIELQLSPQAKNISAFANSKSIHVNKPIELPKISTDYIPDRVREYNELLAEYSLLNKPKVQGEKKKNSEKQYKNMSQDLEKHKRQLAAYQSLKEYIDFYDGDWAQKLSEVPKSMMKYWDLDLPVYANYEKANEKIKILELKQQRAQELLNNPIKNVKPTAPHQAYKNVNVSMRKLELDSGLLAFIGKSAKDNLLLLRNAKPWFLWMHLKDLPGSHVIVVKNKSQKLSEKDLYTVAKWLLLQQFQNKKNKIGEKFDVIYTECRYVRPIKGNKAGLVNYQNERAITVKFE